VIVREAKETVIMKEAQLALCEQAWVVVLGLRELVAH